MSGTGRTGTRRWVLFGVRGGGVGELKILPSLVYGGKDT